MSFISWIPYTLPFVGLIVCLVFAERDRGRMLNSIPLQTGLPPQTDDEKQYDMMVSRVIRDVMRPTAEQSTTAIQHDGGAGSLFTGVDDITLVNGGRDEEFDVPNQDDEGSVQMLDTESEAEVEFFDAVEHQEDYEMVILNGDQTAAASRC
ncbi:hypothetical protein P153DRAFT_386122 [Dothidotthia symphoricarpi CBS 119687]|uniref:Uncharacterized protein n=1 Tax=Dothidotthia symphoricarpi CBS 119687 TaxID=1392245 RepID=A0A6A6ADA8_9PLEO|nr:uncharacterized protein P153DRAFT_386122 [Dothidotthia symphoricarpi CBS 119687]KAF2128918.1 hypothetical protein P153DRAFT_386122 [Dothidotthia symphoricarpi CBS 119687]